MKFSIRILFVLVVALALVEASPLEGSAEAPLKEKLCMKDCDGVPYNPVCVGDETGNSNNNLESFASECVLSNYNCEYNQSLKVVSRGECPGGGSIRLD